MNRSLSVFLAIVLLFTSGPFPFLNAVNSQDIPDDPNQAYPIEDPTPIPEEGDIPLDIPYDPQDAYPIGDGDEFGIGTGFDIPAEYVEFPVLIPGQTPEGGAQLPMPEMEMVEVYQPPIPEPQVKPLRISLSVEPQIYVENQPIEISWQLKNLGLEGLDGKIMRFYLPADLRPADPTINTEVSDDSILDLPASSEKSTLSFIFSGEFEDKDSFISLRLELLEGKILLDNLDIQIPAHGYTLEEIQRENLKIYFPNEVDISTDDKPIEKNLIFHIGPPIAQNMPSYSLSGNPFEILAVNPDVAKNVTQFDKALEITLVYEPEQFEDFQEEGLQVFYFDDELNDWFPYETMVDSLNKTLTFQTDHLTLFDIKASDWQAYMPPSIQDFEVSGFTGAATYSYPIQTFEGAGGLKPELNLTYNSQIVDQGVAFTQASWVGMGWNLDTGFITRDMHGTPFESDDTFIVNFNGVSGRLLPISANEYVLQTNPSERFFFDGDTNSWEMKTGDGIIYIFGGLEAVAKYHPTETCTKNPTSSWKWGLSKIVDSYSNEINFSYARTAKRVPDCLNQIDIIPAQISYGNFKIVFNVESRQDYRISWLKDTSMVNFSKHRLESIDLFVSNIIVKSYLFKYATEPGNQIMPGLEWQDGVKTSTLESIQELANRTDTPVQGYKATTFFYDYVHLIRAENGYGGQVSFEYKAFYDFSANASNTVVYDFVREECGATCPSDYLGWKDDLPNTEMKRVNIRYHRSPVRRSSLYINFSYDELINIYTAFPETILKPGNHLRMTQEAYRDAPGYSNYSDFGFRSRSDPTKNKIWSTLSIPSPLEWTSGSDEITLPFDYDINDIQLYIEVYKRLVLGNYKINAANIRYAVTKKTVADTVQDTSATWEYSYPETFQMNTAAQGEKLYVEANTEFWGFSNVTITQTDNVSGNKIVTEQFFDQSRALKGKLLKQLVRSENDECFSQSLYTFEIDTFYSPSSLYNQKLREYADLAVVWTRISQTEDYSYDGVTCSSLGSASTLGSRKTYSYLSTEDANYNRNLNPTRTNNEIYDGTLWSTQSVENWSYKPKQFYTINNKKFEFHYLLNNQYLTHPDSGTLSETHYSYSSGRPVLIGTKDWVDATGTTKLYALTNYSWDGKGRLATKTSYNEAVPGNNMPGGASLTASYIYGEPDFPNLVTKETISGSDGLSFTTQTSYNQLGLPVMVTHPDGSTESAAYDDLGRIIGVCGRGFNCNLNVWTLTVTYEMDATPPSVTIKRQDTASIRYSYTGFGEVKEKVILGAEIEGEIQNWTEQVFNYDGLGNVLSQSNAGLSRITESDALGRMVRVARIDGESEQTELIFTYALLSPENNNKFFWEKSTTDAKGNVSKEYTNGLGQLVRVVPPTGPESIFEYDNLGRLIKTIYGGAETEISYNAAGQKTWMDDADMGVWMYSYDAWGNLLNQTDARGKVITMSYDSFSRLNVKSTSEGIVSYSYDEHDQIGYRTGMKDQSGETEWIYDKRGRLIQEEKTVLGGQYRTVWAYNNADQLTQMIYPSKEKVLYNYLPQGNVSGVAHYQSQLEVDQHNRVIEKSLYNGNQTKYRYYGWLEEGGGSLKDISASRGSSSKYLDLRYQYDELGNVSQIQDGGNGFQTQSFQYDQLNRLVSAATDNLGEGRYNQSYSYDPDTGNLQNHSDVGEYHYNVLHPHAVETAGVYSYTYDQNGNATSRTLNGQTDSYEYDAENRLTEIEYQDGSIIKFLYDGDGKRVARLNVDNEGTIYIGNYFESEYPYIEDTRPPLYLEPLIPVVSGLCEAETESCAYLPVLAREAELRPFPVKRGTSYYYADGQRIAMRSGSETYLLFGDHLASSILLVRGEGTVAEKAYYLPWGGTRGDETITSTAYAYTGQMREGDIYYYNARWPKVPEAKPKGFDPDIGRFMQAGTIVPLQVGSVAYFIYTPHSGLINHNYIPTPMCQKIGKWKPLIGLVQEQEQTATCTSNVS